MFQGMGEKEGVRRKVGKRGGKFHQMAVPERQGHVNGGMLMCERLAGGIKRFGGHS